MKERRYYQRSPVELAAYYSVVGSGSLTHEATVINISAGGFCFYAQQMLPTGTPVELVIDLKPKEEIKIKVKTAWSKKIGDTGDFMIGVKIDDATGTDLEKFLSYYCHEISQFLVELKNIKKDKNKAA
ncbi:MAG TPA: PilZ domain-containing protein [Candidatus Omnitrophota bacterium]|nr:PilZ domain-containing protein [Candidatus Omnitrophota bacterium]